MFHPRTPRRFALSHRLAVALIAAATLANPTAAAAEPSVDSTALPRVPATPAPEAAATFRLRPGFTAQLVAAEPLVESPVALAFDAERRAYVVEMRDYSERRPQRLGRIRQLQDPDGDGTFDTASVFLADLPWPTAVTCWDGGIWVGSTPDLIFAQDRDGDGRAEVREVVFTGFASDFAPYATNQLNVQALLNSLQWGLDQRIHGSASLAGGTVRLVDSAFTRAWRARAGVTNAWPAPVPLRGSDFSFDPRTLEFRAETGGGQHGMSFDDAGRKYVCSNSDHLQQVRFDATQVPPHPLRDLPDARVSIAADGPAAPVFRTSPDEPWRVLRTRWRVAGLVPGPVEGGGRPSGYFTGATGATIYRGDAYGPDYAGSAFIGDAGSNLIHRKRLRTGPDGITRIGERAASELDREFLASTDNWFRPVQFVNAPDGCLWVIDMYRETIEHPWSLPDGLKQHLDLDSGSNRGRLWRLAPVGFRPPGRPATPICAEGTAEWIEQLASGNGWVRDRAARRLHEVRDPASPAALRAMLSRQVPMVARLHALHVLHGLNALDSATLHRAANDPAGPVRAHVARLAAATGYADESTWNQLAADPDAEVRLEVALAVSRLPVPLRATVLAGLLTRGPAWVRQLALPAAEGHEAALWEGLQTTPHAPLEARAELARWIGRRGDPDLIQKVATAAARPNPPSESWLLWSALLEGLNRRGGSALDPSLAERLAPALARAQTALSQNSDAAQRAAALRLVSLAPADLALPTLTGVLRRGTPEEQATALTALGRFQGPTWAQALVDRASSAGPLRPQLYAQLVRRPEGQAALVAALEGSRLRATDLTTEAIQSLRQASDATVRQGARRWLGEPPVSRQAAVESRLGALRLAGQPAAGATVFQERCAGCHVFRGVGQNLGPDLASVAANGPEKLLVAILDPNREVAPNFTAWLAETSAGETLSGVLQQESADQVVLRQAGGASATVPRKELKRWENTGRSLMPEGLEEGLDDQRFADLLSYLTGK